jgi:hypothetical protein
MAAEWPSAAGCTVLRKARDSNERAGQTGPLSVTSDRGHLYGNGAHQSGGHHGSVDRRRMRKRSTDRIHSKDRRCIRRSTDRRRRSVSGSANARDAANTHDGYIAGNEPAQRWRLPPAVSRQDCRPAPQTLDPPARRHQAEARRMPAMWTVSSCNCSISFGLARPSVIRKGNVFFGGLVQPFCLLLFSRLGDGLSAFHPFCKKRSKPA